jgi:hypothetical protein
MNRLAGIIAGMWLNLWRTLKWVWLGMAPTFVRTEDDKVEVIDMKKVDGRWIATF